MRAIELLFNQNKKPLDIQRSPTMEFKKFHEDVVQEVILTGKIACIAVKRTEQFIHNFLVNSHLSEDKKAYKFVHYESDRCFGVTYCFILYCIAP